MNTLILENDDTHGEIVTDVYQKLSNDRILFISDYVDDNLASYIVANIIAKDSENSEQKISFFINCEGGDIRNIFMIHDMMKMAKSPIETVCLGSAMNEAVILLAAGTPGLRYATKHSVICPSQLNHDRGQYSDLTEAKNTLDQAKDDNKKKMSILAKCTGKTLKQVMSDFERKKFMTPKQAVAYGIIDGIISYTK